MFPILSRFAKDVLSVLVSTVFSKSAFSSCRRTLDDRRMSLSLDMFEILTIVKDWEHAELRGQEMTRNSNKLVDLFNDLYVNDDDQSSLKTSFS